METHGVGIETGGGNLRVRALKKKPNGTRTNKCPKRKTEKRQKKCPKTKKKKEGKKQRRSEINSLH